ncbi:efflux RND transporter permease subunit [Thalassotalea sp. PS06]|uniref:efflux RND transporter permease subunit n=1 Tax=Thalassotalea sp. PS06 TaxID=2594005 RepID=UPI001162165D|nr:efflux RND transporter permease subunit [Thalassotalea sp. PS06]QDP02403.1 efflux RND transporter permease subunit [Thalassotalea sp. PS06]
MLDMILKKPIVLLVAILIICLFGLAAAFRVPIQMIPDLDPRIITVETRWPGATPQDIETEILLEQEEYLKNINGLQRMVSSASFGSAEIELEFPFGMEINEALILVNNALSQVPSYPENVDEPAVIASSFSGNSFMYFSIQFKGEDSRDITHQQDWIEDNIKTRLERIPGIARANVSGGAQKQIHIRLKPAELSSRGLTVADVRNAIRTRNRDVSGGDMDFGKRRYLIRTLGKFEDLNDLNNLIISEQNGYYVRLKDVGLAEMSYEEMRSFRTTIGQQTMGISIARQVDANVISLKKLVMDQVAELNRTLLADQGLVMTLNSEDVRYVENSASTVIQNLIIGTMLATLVLLLFLRSVSATLIGALGIPICILAAFLGLSLSGRSINVVSLAGVAFAIGMTLDNAIVALENITRHVAMGKRRRDAAIDGIREVWPAILASTLTTVMVFLPIVFLEQEAGQLYGDIAIAIAASIIMSMLVAITLIPVASQRILNVREMVEHKGKLDKALHVTTNWGESMAKRILGFSRWILKRTSRQVGAVAITLAITLFTLFALVPDAEYLPEGEEAKVFARLMAPPGYNMETMKDLWRQVDSDFTENVDRTNVSWLNEEQRQALANRQSDESASSGAAVEISDEFKTDVPPLAMHISFMSPGTLTFITEPISRHDTPQLVDAISERFNAIPGMRSFASRGSIFSGNQGGTRSLNIELKGRDLGVLYNRALQLMATAGKLIDGAQLNANPSPPTLSMSQPMVEVIPDWQRAAELGISQTDLGYSIWAYSDGAFVDEFYIDDEKIDMLLFAKQGTVNSPRELEHLMFYGPNGQQVPLSALVSLNETVDTATISRVDGMRTVTLQIVPPRNMALEQALKIVENDLLAPLSSTLAEENITHTISGAASELAQTREAMQGNFLLAIIIAYLLMVAVFSNWGYPLLIMTTVPIGISGGIIGLGLFNLLGSTLPAFGLSAYHQPFDVITMLGFLVLIGTVVNNPILIVERSIANLQQQSMAIKEAIVEALSVRLRPVMMSTITTIFGLSPLVFIPGEGTELYRGLGVIVLFGLLFSSLVTLLILPAFLSLVFQIQQRWQLKKSTDNPADDEIKADSI